MGQAPMDPNQQQQPMGMNGMQGGMQQGMMGQQQQFMGSMMQQGPNGMMQNQQQQQPQQVLSRGHTFQVIDFGFAWECV